jgi:hypothetical protein
MEHLDTATLEEDFHKKFYILNNALVEFEMKPQDGSKITYSNRKRRRNTL